MIYLTQLTKVPVLTGRWQNEYKQHLRPILSGLLGLVLLLFVSVDAQAQGDLAEWQGIQNMQSSAGKDSPASSAFFVYGGKQTFAAQKEPSLTGEQKMMEGCVYFEDFDSGPSDWDLTRSTDDETNCVDGSAGNSIKLKVRGVREAISPEITLTDTDLCYSLVFDYYTPTFTSCPNAVNCEQPDSGDEMQVQTSTVSATGPWTTVAIPAYTSGSKSTVSVDLPCITETTTLYIRFYQPNNGPVNTGGVCAGNLGVDHHLVDNICVQGTSPSPVCLDITVSLDGEGNASITPEEVFDAANSPDYCGTYTPLSVTPNSFSCKDVGPNTVTLTVELSNECGTSEQTCMATVTVEDNEDPVLTCMGPLTFPNDPGLCEATIDLPIPDASDNCEIATFEYRYVLIDENNDEIGPFSDWFDVEIDGTVTLEVGRYRLRFRASDPSGNQDGCNQIVTIEDIEGPMINACVGTTVVFNGEDSFLSADVIDFSAEDNCGVIVSTTFDPAVISCEDLGSTVTVTITVVDDAGNPNSCMADVKVEGLPCDYMLSEIGCAGDADYDVPTETFSLESTNCYYTSPFNQDKITFVKTELCGDGEIIAEVTNIDAYGWAGIVMRETLDAGSKKIALSRDNGNFARREARTATNGPAYPQQFPAFGKNWLRLVRQGNFFIGYVSPNGINWQQVMVSQISMSECIYVGMFLTNKQFSTQTISADFNNVEVNPVGGGPSLQQLPSSAPTALGDISVYPNPTAGLVTVDLGAMLDQVVLLELRNTNGQVLRQLDLGQVSERRTELQLGDLPVGIYWLRVQAEGQVPVMKRIVVQ